MSSRTLYTRCLFPSFVYSKDKMFSRMSSLLLFYSVMFMSACCTLPLLFCLVYFVHLHSLILELPNILCASCVMPSLMSLCVICTQHFQLRRERREEVDRMHTQHATLERHREGEQFRKLNVSSVHVTNIFAHQLP